MTDKIPSMEEQIERFKIQLEKERNTEIKNCADDIARFRNYCADKSIHFEDSELDFAAPVGLTLKRNGLLDQLLTDTDTFTDKDGLFYWSDLEANGFEPRLPGFLFSENFVAIPDRYFRRGFGECSNYTPSLVPILWATKEKGISKRIKLDANRVRVNRDSRIYLEEDHWYGPSFSDSVSDIEDGNSVFRPPLDLDSDIASLLFSENYALNTMWSHSKHIKTFQAIEFKNEDARHSLSDKSIHPTKYIHAEYDINSGYFRHLDGAIHFYSREEYLRRRDSNFNYSARGTNKEKADSIKIFRMDGEIPISKWVEICGHFFAANPLIHEYFTGNYPDYISERLSQLRSRDV